MGYIMTVRLQNHGWCNYGTWSIGIHPYQDLGGAPGDLGQHEPSALVSGGLGGAVVGDAHLDAVLPGGDQPAVDALPLAGTGHVHHHREVPDEERYRARHPAAHPGQRTIVRPARHLGVDVVDGDGELGSLDHSWRWRIELVDQPSHLGHHLVVLRQLLVGPHLPASPSYSLRRELKQRPRVGPMLPCGIFSSSA